MIFLRKVYENEFTAVRINFSKTLLLQTTFDGCLTHSSNYPSNRRFSRMTNCVIITSSFTECLFEKTLLWRNAFFQCRFENVVFLSCALASSFVGCAFDKCTFVDCKIGGEFKDCTAISSISAKNYIVTDAFPVMASAENKRPSPL